MSELFEGFETAEITYVIELLAAMASDDEIKEKFFKFTYPGKSISSKQIQKISLRFAKQIRDRNEAYLRNIKGNPLAHQRVRLDILFRIIEDCKKERPSHSVKISDSEWEVHRKPDHASAINALKVAMTDLYKREELDLEKAGSADDSGDFEIDDGMAAS